MPAQIDPFAPQGPTLPAPEPQEEKLEPPVRDLAGAPEVGITAAQTAPKTRQRRSERDKAQQQLDVALRRVQRLEKSSREAQAEAERLSAEYKAAVARVDYLQRHPALVEDEDVAPGLRYPVLLGVQEDVDA